MIRTKDDIFPAEMTRSRSAIPLRGWFRARDASVDKTWAKGGCSSTGFEKEESFV